MWDPDKWFRGSVVCQLLDESRLQARERIDRLGQQIDRFVDDQEPGVVDKNLDGFGIGHLENRERIASRCLQLRDDRATIAPSGQKKTRNTGHEINASKRSSLSASRKHHVPVKCSVGQEGSQQVVVRS